MEVLIDLWLPILLSAWVILPHHFADKKKLPDEDAVMKMVRELNIPTGNYFFPYTGSKAEQNSPEYQEKYKAGPRGL